MHKALLLTAISVLFSSNLFSQSIYILTPYSELYKVEVDLSLSYIVTIDDSQIDVPFGDIAISPSNTFYGISQNKIFEIDIQDGSTTLVVTLPDFAAGNSLVCSHNYELYTIDAFARNLVKYDLTTNSSQVVDYLGLNTPGDLTLHKGNVLFPTYDESIDEHALMAYNLSSKELTKVQCLNNDWLLGIGNSFESCESNTIIVGTDQGSLYEVDIDDQQISNYAIDLVSQGIYGIASDNEYQASNCSYQFSEVGCITSTSQNQANTAAQISLYPIPFADKLNFSSSKPLTRIQVFNTSGQELYNFSNPTTELNLSNLASGTYILRLESDGYITHRRVVKI